VNKLWCAAVLAVWMTSSWASADSLRSVGMETSDKTGCRLSDGKSVVGSTIHLMVDAYRNHPKLKDETILEIITTAIKAGCDIHEASPSGLSPLNSAILLNHPVLVSLFLENGANPTLKNCWIEGGSQRQGLLRSLQIPQDPKRHGRSWPSSCATPVATETAHGRQPP
jgi:hypothetical protein